MPSSFHTLLVIGLEREVMLAVTHQVFWDTAFGDDPPRLGGNLEGRLSPGVESLVLRTFAFFSSLVTGAVVGYVVRAIGWGIDGVRRATLRMERGDDRVRR